MDKFIGSVFWRLIKAVVFMAVWFWCAAHVAEFGSRWEAVSHTTKNVEAILMDNSRCVGDMRMSWGGVYTIQAADGKECQFSDFKMMAFKPEETGSNLFFSWRIATVFSLLILATVFAYRFFFLMRKPARDGTLNA